MERRFIIKGMAEGFGYDVDLTDATFSVEVVPFDDPDSDEDPSSVRYRRSDQFTNKVDVRKEEALYRSHAEARAALSDMETPILPSWREIGGKTKAFDDGFYAAVELTMQKGLGIQSIGKIQFLSNLAQNIRPLAQMDDPFMRQVTNCALSYVGSALELADVRYEFEHPGAKDFAREHLQDKTSKPLGFYDWNDELRRVFRQDRQLQRKLGLKGLNINGRQFADGDVATGAAILITQIIQQRFSEQYKMIVGTYERMTNPLASLSVREYAEVLKSCGEDFGTVLQSRSKVRKFAEKLREHPAYKTEFERLRNTGIDPEEEIGFALEPSSRSVETDLFMKLGAGSIGGNLMDVFIKAVRNGTVDLKPKEGDGWYSWQQYAIGQLLDLPHLREATKIRFGENYVKLIEEGVKSAFTQARETHIKQLEVGCTLGGSPKKIEIDITPQFSAEPLPTNYLWVARGYRFLKFAVEELLGEDALTKIKRLKEGGSKSEISLAKETDQIVGLLYGIHGAVCDELGIESGLTDGEVTTEDLGKYKSHAKEWLADIRTDEDLQRDRRVIVPLHSRPGECGMETVNWAVIGVEAKQVRVKWEKPPIVKIFDSENIPHMVEIDNNSGNGVISVRNGRRAETVHVNLRPQDYFVLYDVFSEVARPASEEPLTRDEYRKLIDPLIGKPVHVAKEAVGRLLLGKDMTERVSGKRPVKDLIEDWRKGKVSDPHPKIEDHRDEGDSTGDKKPWCL